MRDTTREGEWGVYFVCQLNINIGYVDKFYHLAVQ